MVWKPIYPALSTPFDLAHPDKASESTAKLFAPDIKKYSPPIDNSAYKLSEYMDE